MSVKLRLVLGVLVVCGLVYVYGSETIDDGDVLGVEEGVVAVLTPGEVVPNTDFMVTVGVGELVDFDAGQFDLHYDPAVLRLDDITNGWIGGVPTPVAAWKEFDPGHARAVVNVPGLPGVTGSGYLATVHFHVVGSYGDSCVVDLSRGFLNDNCAEEIVMDEWVGGVVTVGSGDLVDIAVAGGDWSLGDGRVELDRWYYSSVSGGPPSDPVLRGECGHVVENVGVVDVDVSVSFGNMEGYGSSWVNSVDGTWGVGVFSFVCQEEGRDWSEAMIVGPDPVDLISDLGVGSSRGFVMGLHSPTGPTVGYGKSGVVVVTATVSVEV